MSDPCTVLQSRFVYRLTRADLAAWAAVPRELTLPGKIVFMVPFLATCAALGWFGEQLAERLGVSGGLAFEVPAVMAIAAAAAGLAMTVEAGLRVWRVATARLPRRETVVGVFPDRVTVSQDGNDRSYEWASFGDAIRRPGYAFLILSDREAIILPERAFQDPDAMDVFVMASKACIDGADCSP